MQFKKIFLNTYFLITFLTFSACSIFKANIKEIDSITQVQEELQKVDDKTLVVFDIDDTLIAPTENAFFVMHSDLDVFDPSDVDFVKQVRKCLGKLAVTKNDPKYFRKITQALYSKTNFIPVEPQTVEIVKKLQDRGIKVIALTAALTDEDVQKQANLTQIGLDFSKSFDFQRIELEKLLNVFGFFPVFFNGILLASGNTKGKVLAAFLEKIGLRPSKIIFLDNSCDFCKSVDSEMNKLGIPVQCYWYKAIYNKKVKINQNVVKLQLEHWEKHEEFLTEREIMDSKK